jgi:hypothetical protein
MLEESEPEQQSSVRSNSCALLLFPLVIWALEKKSSPDSKAVFLRAVKGALESPSKGDSLLARVEPLLSRTPPETIEKAIAAGLTSLDPLTRSFCQLLRSLAGVGKG